MNTNTPILRLLCATLTLVVLTPLAWAAVPVAVWDGDFSSLEKEGFTIEAPAGVTVAGGSITIGLEATSGIKITHDDTWNGSDGIAVAIRYSNLTAGSGDRAIGSFKLDSKDDCVGVRITSEGKSAGVYAGNPWASEGAGHVKNVLVPASGTVFLNYKDADYTRLYAADGTYLYNGPGLREGSKQVGNLITIGALAKDAMVANGLVITGLAIFNQGLSATDVLAYKFPSEQTEGGVVAKIGTDTYETLAAAIAAAVEGTTIEIVDHVVETTAIELTKNITLTVGEGTKNLLAPITGAGTITKAGPGTLTVFSLASGLTVSEGIIKAGDNNPFGTAAHTVTVVAGGTIDFNGKGNSTTVTYTIAGAGAGDHPYALMNSVAGTGTANLGNVTLSADATIGGAGNLSIAAPTAGGTLFTKGFTLTKAGTGVLHGGSLSYRDEDFGTGVVDIAEGTISINQWGCGFYNLKVIVRNGATLTHNNVDARTCTVRDLVVEQGGHVTGATASRYLLVSGTCESAGELSGIAFANGATLKLTSDSGVTVGRFIDVGTFTVDLAGLAIPEGETVDIPAIVAPAGTSFNLAKVSITGADGKWVAVEKNGTLTVRKVPALATVDGESYTSVAEAFAAADGKTVNVLYPTSEAIVVNGNVTVVCAEGAAIGGAITGTGSITIPEGVTVTYSGTASIEPTVKGEGTLLVTGVPGNLLPPVNGLTEATWTGTVWLKGMTGKTNINLQNLGNAESTIRISGLQGWMVNAQTIAADVVLANEGYAYGFNINNGSSGDESVSTFNKLSGDGMLLADGRSTAGFLIKNWSDFSGAVTAVDKTITFGTTPKANLNKIIVEKGSVVTCSNTWTSNGGIVVEGTLIDAGALASPVSGSGEVVYVGALPTDATAAGYTNAVWTGTLVLKDYGEVNGSGNVIGTIPTTATAWGHAGSKVRFTNVKAYVPNDVTSYPWTLVLQDGENGETAWFNNNGYSTYGQTRFGGLAGDGTFVGGGATPRFAFGDVTAYSGDLTADGKRITFGSTEFLATGNNTLVLTGTIATAGQTWTAAAGVTVKAGTTLVYAGGALKLVGPLTLEGTATVDLGDGFEIPDAGVKVLTWDERPEGVTFAKGTTLPPKARLIVKGDGLYLTKLLPFVLSIR